jgi:diketogulonate reductase-like aldo/keto reductase
MTQPALSRLEAGGVVPTIPLLERISRKQVTAGTGSSPSGLDIAAELGTTPSWIALARTLLNPAVTAPIVGARSLAQLDDNLGALDVRLDPAQQAGLAELSAIELGFPTVPCAASTSPDKRVQHDAASARELAASDSRPTAN